jgi:hypothetical protein
MQEKRVRDLESGFRSIRIANCLRALAILVCVARADPSSSTVTVQCRFFPGLATMDGNWAPLKAASDGRVYVGLACHGCDGHLVFYDSKRDRMVDVGDPTRLAGENGLGAGTAV